MIAKPLVLCLLLAAGWATDLQPAVPPAMEAADAAAVERLLAAGDPAAVAWGAYHAGRLGLPGAVPALVTAVERCAGQPPTEPRLPWRQAARSCLAALIDLGRPVPPAAPGLAWAVGDLDAAVILAALDPAAGRSLLARAVRWESISEATWTACANLLAAGDGDVRDLVRGLQPCLRIAVADPGAETAFQVRSGSGRRALQKGFPPAARWIPGLADAPGARLLADGPTPVWISRDPGSVPPAGVIREGDPWLQRMELTERRLAYRLVLLRRRLGGLPPPPPIFREVEVPWDGPEALLGEVARQRAAGQAGWDEWFAALARAGMAEVPCPVLLVLPGGGGRSARSQPLPPWPAMAGDDAAGVSRLFACATPYATAWAAHHAARLGLVGCAADLERGIRQAAAEADGYAQAVRQACGDALIGLGVTPEPATIAAMDACDARVILALGDPVRHRGVLIEALHGAMSASPSWHAAAEALASRRDPEAALILTGLLAPRVAVQVWAGDGHPAEPPVQRPSRMGSGSIAYEGFPGDAPWVLATAESPGARVVAAGPPRIWAGHGGAAIDLPTDGQRPADLLARMAGLDPAEVPRVRATAAIGWHGPADLAAQTARLRDGHQRAWDAFMARLAATGAVPAGTPAPRAQIEIDDRRDGGDPLPSGDQASPF